MEPSYGYELLLDSIKNLEVDNATLQKIKLSFKTQIDSVRRFELIQSLNDLLFVLESRDIINEYDVSALAIIANDLGSPDILLGISQYVPSREYVPCNEYALQRQREQEQQSDEQQRQFNNLRINNLEQPAVTEEAEIYPKVPPVQSVNYLDKSIFEQKRELIYRYICDNIGQKWRAFGRELKICEGEMDNLQQDFVGNARERNRKMLQMIEDEERVDPRRIALIICNALKTAKRDDMRYHIEEILSR